MFHSLTLFQAHRHETHRPNPLLIEEQSLPQTVSDLTREVPGVDEVEILNIDDDMEQLEPNSSKTSSP